VELYRITIVGAHSQSHVIYIENKTTSNTTESVASQGKWYFVSERGEGSVAHSERGGRGCSTQ